MGNMVVRIPVLEEGSGVACTGGYYEYLINIHNIEDAK